MGSNTLHKLAEILDTLINQDAQGKEKDSNSINALLNSVLVSYENRKLDKDPSILQDSGFSESQIVDKIFSALKAMLIRDPSLLVEDNRHVIILKSTFPFFDSLNCPIDLVDKILFSLIQICSNCFRRGILAYNRLISQQREYIFKYLDSILSNIIKSFTNTDTPEITLDSTQNIKDLENLVSIEKFSHLNLSKISKISQSIKILEFLIHPSIYKQYFIQHQSSFILDSYISKCWFCLENIVVNVKFIPENNNIISVLDNIYSTLLLSTVNYYYNDQSYQFNRLQLAINSCHFLLNWSLLANFESLQIILAQCLLKLTLQLDHLGNAEYLWRNIGITENSMAYYTQLIDKISHPELKNAMKLLSNAKYNKLDDRLNVSKMYPVSQFQTIELQSLHQRIDSCFFYKNIKFDAFITELTPDIIDQYDSDLTYLSSSLQNFSKIDLIKTINRLGLYACYLSDNYDINTQSCKLCDSNFSITSYITKNVDLNRNKIQSGTKIDEVYQLLNRVIETFSSGEDLNITIAILVALTRVFRSFRPLQLGADFIWKFIKVCFVHKAREIRLLSVKLFPLIIYSPIDSQYEYDLDLIFKYLSAFDPQTCDFYIFEGYIMLLGELLIVKSVDPSYYIILNKLVEFMSDMDEFRSNMAIHELRLVAATKNVTPWQIVEPFIPLISRDIVKNRDRKPGILENFCIAIEMNLPLFLERTLEYTVPFLIDSYKQDHISFIASHINRTKAQIIEMHIDKILAYLFTTYEDISQSKILNILSIYDPKYKHTDFNDLVIESKGPIFLYDILYHYNSEEGSLKRIQNAIGTIAVTLNYGTEKEVASQKILNRWLLIIVQLISTKLNDQKGYNPYTVKIRAIKSILCLLKLCDNFEACLRQITTALQMSLKYEELRTEALVCIESIIQAVSANNVEFIFDSLISQFLLQYNSFSDSNKKLVEKIIQLLAKVMPRKVGSYMYAMKKLSGFKNVNFQYLSDKRFILNARSRLKSDNQWVVEQALDDILDFFEINQVKLYQSMKDDEVVHSYILLLIDSLITNTYRTDPTNLSKVPYKSARVISLIGNMDKNVTRTSNTELASDHFDNVNKFLLVTELYPKKNSEQETMVINFSLHFLKNILVRSFISSVDPDEQRSLSFAIQEYLAVFQFPSNAWDSLDALTKNVLEPLKVSRYKKTFSPQLVPYPIYKNTKEYSVWVKELTSNLLYFDAILAETFANMPPAMESVCSVIPVLDISVSKFVLPYAVLFMIIVESENHKHRKDLHAEFMLILNQNLSSITNDVVKDELKKCIILILEIFQFLKAWASKVKEEEDLIKATNRSALKYKKSGIQRIEKFLNSFPTNILAKRCAECDMYEGSILFLEQSYNKETIAKEDFFSTLKDMYVQLEDYDQLHGALKTFSTNSLNDKLLQFKYNEDPQISNESLTAIAQYNFDEERDTVSELSQSSVTELFEVLNKNCEYDQLLLNLKKYSIDIENGKTSEILSQEWILHGIQASIFTGDINDLLKWINLSQKSNVIAIPGSDLSIYYEIAAGLMALHNSLIPNCIKHIDKAQSYIGLAIANSKNSVHRKVPDYMALLHALYDFKLLSKMDDRNNSTIQHLKRRLQGSKQDFKSIWKIHSLKSTIYRLHPGDAFPGLYKESLIEGCEILRENGKLPQATKLITKALVLNDNDTAGEMTQASTMLMNVEFSKLFWAQNDYETALKTMSLVVDDMKIKNNYYLEFTLTYLNWLDISAEGSSDLIRDKYSVLLAEKSLDKSSDVYYQYAAYLNKLLEAQSPLEADGQLDIQVIKYYMFAVSYSNKYVHRVLPKAVTLWLDYYQKYLVIDSGSNISRKIVDSRNNIYLKINLVIEKCVSELGNKWYVVLSQIISRITHDDKRITDITSRIIIELTIKYPWLLLYSVFAQARSVDPDRRRIGSKILGKLQDTKNRLTNGTSQLATIIASGLMLLESIMSVCNISQKYKHPRSGNLIKDLYKDLNFDYPRDSECRALALPIKANMDLLYNLRNDVEKKVVFYNKFHEKVKVLFSLQQPKRIRITGTDGYTYYLLFKPHDDLRKDNKVMEFSTVMNDLLSKNYETQRRNMSIESFAATPLNETTGIIEWVQNFYTLRPIIDLQLKRNGNSLSLRNLKTELGDASESEKLTVYESYLKKYPPVLGEWMVENSPNITQWYNFRSMYTRSLAVMSIVGYLIGIGDRHLDNIMLNKNTGMIMHIDFDCIFEKGKKLGVPEIVPFRLTPNLEDAMGVLRYEGSFRKACELTMSLIRNNENILMNFLESFIHDPLMDWRGSSEKNHKEEKYKQRIKQQQEQVYKIIRRKICGILTKDDDNTGYRDSGGLSVSVSFQVDLLIQTAVNHENLSKMFVGWMPFL